MTTGKDALKDSVAPTGSIASRSVGAADRAAPKPPRILRRMLALDDFEEAARRFLPRPIFGYVAGGVETNAALRANREVWDQIAFVPRMLVDVANGTQRASLFDRTYDAPFGLAPMGGTAMAAYQGDSVLARAAAAATERRCTH